MSTWLSRMAHDLLDSAVLCYGAADAPPVPTRQLVAHGIVPALDCPMLAVVVGNLTAAAKGAPRCAVVPQARFVIWVVRCYPTMDDAGHPPSPRAQTEASDMAADDLATLWDGLTLAWSENRLLPAFPQANCEAVTWGIAVPAGPLGGVAGFQWPLTVDCTGLRLAP